MTASQKSKTNKRNGEKQKYELTLNFLGTNFHWNLLSNRYESHKFKFKIIPLHDIKARCVIDTRII